MADLEQLKILDQGVLEWNAWHLKNPQVEIDLTEVNLYEVDLRGIDLKGANLTRSYLEKVDLRDANLLGACLEKVNLSASVLWRASLKEANLRESNLSYADLRESDLSYANLSDADLSHANLRGAKLRKVRLKGADLTEAILMETDLRGAYLMEAKLVEVNLKGANLEESNLTRSNLKNADLKRAKLREANLWEATLSGANLEEADLTGANLTGAELIGARLRGADLWGSHLESANFHKSTLDSVVFSQANLMRTDFSGAEIGYTIFADTDLSESLNLDKVKHRAPTTIGEDSIAASRGKLPVSFLRGCGLSDIQIETSRLFNPNLTNDDIVKIQYKIYDLRATQAIQISPLFISYSHADSTFVDKLEESLNAKGIRFWRDIHNAIAGRLETQIDRAIRQNPTVLLILSRSSLGSDWVQHEVRKARELEKELGRDALCPIALDDTWKKSNWPQRIIEQIMEYNILDFSVWEDKTAFDSKFTKLLSGLDLFYKKPS